MSWPTGTDRNLPGSMVRRRPTRWERAGSSLRIGDGIGSSAGLYLRADGKLDQRAGCGQYNHHGRDDLRGLVVRHHGATRPCLVAALYCVLRSGGSMSDRLTTAVGLAVAGHPHREPVGPTNRARDRSWRHIHLHPGWGAARIEANWTKWDGHIGAEKVGSWIRTAGGPADWRVPPEMGAGRAGVRCSSCFTWRTRWRGRRWM